MRILIVTPEFPPDTGGGIISYYRDLVPALRRRGCEVVIVKGSAVTHGGADHEEDGVRVVSLKSEQFQKWLIQFRNFEMFPQLQRHLAASFAIHDQVSAGEGFDLVEVSDWGLLFLPWAIIARARVAVQLHGSCGQIAEHEPVAGAGAETAFLSLLEQAAFSTALGVTSYSKKNCIYWQDRVHCPITYIPPPVPVQNNRDGFQNGDRWLAVGRVQHWKGPHIACEAWELLGSLPPPLDWIGRDTAEGATGQSTDDSLRLRFPQVWDVRIARVPQTPTAEVVRRMQNAKVVLVPSLWDVFNLVTAEAMSLGKPVVVSDGAGAAELITSGENGFVFHAGDAAALADMVKQVEALDLETLQRIGRNAQETVMQKLNPDRIADLKLAFYRNLPDGAPPKLDWLRDVLKMPSDPAQLRFLDQLPLRKLASYVFTRALRKARATWLER